MPLANIMILSYDMYKCVLSCKGHICKACMTICNCTTKGFFQPFRIKSPLPVRWVSFTYRYNQLHCHNLDFVHYLPCSSPLYTEVWGSSRYGTDSVSRYHTWQNTGTSLAIPPRHHLPGCYGDEWEHYTNIYNKEYVPTAIPRSMLGLTIVCSQTMLYYI